jgi:hypothetical protein
MQVYGPVFPANRNDLLRIDVIINYSDNFSKIASMSLSFKAAFSAVLESELLTLVDLPSKRSIKSASHR